MRAIAIGEEPSSILSINPIWWNPIPLLFDYNDRTYSFFLSYHVNRIVILYPIAYNSNIEEMASLSVIESKRESAMTTEEKLLFPGQSRVHKLYSAIWFRRAEEGHDLYCVVNIWTSILNIWHYKINVTYRQWIWFLFCLRRVYKLISNNMLQKQLRVYLSS